MSTGATGAPATSGLFTPVTRCWVCGGSDLGPVGEEVVELGNLLADPALEAVLADYHGQRFGLNRCRGCGFMQPSALPSRAGYFDSLYDLKWAAEWMELEFECGYKDFIFETILRELGRRVRGRTGRLLDVGAHVGRMLELARQAGWQPAGIELNPRTAAFAASRTRLPVHRMRAAELAATGARFDAITLTDVLEHIPDPVPVLAELRGVLAPGGWIAVKVPCGASQLLKQRLRHAASKRHDPGIGTSFVHVNHFGPRSLAVALGRAGFESIRVGVGAPELPPGGGLPGAVSRMSRLAVYRAAQLLPLGTHSPLTMNLQAFARNAGGPPGRECES